MLFYLRRRVLDKVVQSELVTYCMKGLIEAVIWACIDLWDLLPSVWAENRPSDQMFLLHRCSSAKVIKKIFFFITMHMLVKECPILIHSIKDFYCISFLYSLLISFFSQRLDCICASVMFHKKFFDQLSIARVRRMADLISAVLKHFEQKFGFVKGTVSPSSVQKWAQLGRSDLMSHSALRSLRWKCFGWGFRRKGSGMFLAPQN